MMSQSEGANRREMELSLAQRFGYDDYQSFQEGVVRTIGKGGLRKLEKELDKYGPAEEASPPQQQQQPPPDRP